MRETRNARGINYIGGITVLRMEKKENNKREAPISYRPPEALKNEFHRRVEKSGLSTSAFITKSIFDLEQPRQARRPAIEKQQLARLMIDLAIIREQLSEISEAEGANQKQSQKLEKMLAELSEIRNSILFADGRKP